MRKCNKCGHKFGKFRCGLGVLRCPCGGLILDWDTRDSLIQVAKTQGVIHYGDIAKTLGIANEAVGFVVGEISEYEHLEGDRPLLSAVVVRKDTGNSGGGFFGLSGVPGYVNRTKRGVDLGNPNLNAHEYAFWKNEQNRVHDWWRKHDP